MELSRWSTLEEICRHRSIQLDTLPDAIEQSAITIAARLAERYYARDELFFVAQCYQALQVADLSANPILSQLRADLSSYKSFRERFMSTSHHTYFDADFRACLGRVISSRTNPLDVVRIGKKVLRGSEICKPHIVRSAEALKEEWTQLRQSVPMTSKYGATYVTAKVNEEMKEVLTNSAGLRIGLNHATTSAALDGIARHGALLSRTFLSQRGESPQSGERADLGSRVHVDTEFNYGKQYSLVGWFDEFPVQIEFHQTVDQYREPYAPDWGISLGHEVPIDQIKTLYVPSQYIAKAESWTSQYCPFVTVKSIELVLTLQRNFRPR